MRERIRAFLCSIRPGRQPSAITMIIVSVVLYTPCAVQMAHAQESHTAATLTTGIALAQTPIIDPLAQQVASNFVNTTLPKLVAGDPLLAKQMGFNNLHDFEIFGVKLEAPLPFFIIDINDLRKFVQGQTRPLDLLITPINWIGTSPGTFRPARFVFPIRLQNDSVGSDGISLSSVIIENTAGTMWRVHKAGGPTLIRAVKTYSTQPQNFVVWIPSINRHYLGRMNPQFQFTMTVLFDDPIADVKAGHEFDPRESRVIEKLKALDKKLQKIFTGKLPVQPKTAP